MKYGNFVGNGWMKFSSGESEMIKLHLQDQLEEVFGKEFFNSPVMKQEYEDIEGNVSNTHVIHLYIQFPLKVPFSGRNVLNDTIKNLTSVNFFVTKNAKGYLEIKDESDPYNIDKYKKDYANCPEFSYGCSMSVTGSERPYRHKNWESIQNFSPYVYGTEIKDITYEKIELYKLKNKMT